MRDYQLYQGDCLEFMKTLKAGSVDAVITDPPYGLGDKWKGGTWFTRGVYEKDKVTWDIRPSQETIDRIIKVAPVVIIWGGNYFSLPPSRCWLSWSKINSMPTMADIELAWTNLDRPSKEYRSLRNGWDREHPTEKPIGLMRWCVENFTEPGDTVIDFYMGSGTTGVACMQLGRRFIGCEIDPDYFKIATRRISQAAQQPSLFEPESKPQAVALELAL